MYTAIYKLTDFPVRLLVLREVSRIPNSCNCETVVIDIHMETKGKCVTPIFLMKYSALHKLYTLS